MAAVIEVPASSRSAGLTRSRLRFAVGLLGTIVLLAVVLPSMAGVAWMELWHTLSAVPTAVLTGLVLLWAAGLALHTITLTAALPGLSARRAATLSLTGSAVANTLPVGGAAGIALNVRMGNVWGFDGRSMYRYTVVTNICDVLVKISLPIIALPVLLRSGTGTHQIALVGPLAAAGALVLGGACATVATRRGATWVGRKMDRAVQTSWGRRLTHPPTTEERAATWEERLQRLQGSVVELLRHRWPRLTLGMVLYTVSLLALMECCLLATGTVVAPVVVLTADQTDAERAPPSAATTSAGAGPQPVHIEWTVTVIAIPVRAAARAKRTAKGETTERCRWTMSGASSARAAGEPRVLAACTHLGALSSWCVVVMTWASMPAARCRVTSSCTWSSMPPRRGG